MLDTLEDGLVPEPQQPATHGDIAALRQELQAEFQGLRRLINGDPNEDVPGVRPRLNKLEQRMTEMPTAKEWQDAKQQLSDQKDRFRIGQWMVLGMWAVIIAIVIAQLTSIGGP